MSITEKKHNGKKVVKCVAYSCSANTLPKLDKTLGH